MGHGAEAEK